MLDAHACIPALKTLPDKDCVFLTALLHTDTWQWGLDLVTQQTELIYSNGNINKYVKRKKYPDQYQ